jgi:hypothetical protein
MPIQSPIAIKGRRLGLALALVLLAAMLRLLAPGGAQAFDPATQAHPGACSETTVDVTRAVHDLRANGVLKDYAEKLGIDAAGESLVKAAEGELVVVPLAHVTVADNHGCEGGVVFPVGPRHLRVGEKVAVRVPAALREHLCAGPHRGCVARRVAEHTVLPINCWNIDEGKATVVLYLRKPKPHVKAAHRSSVSLPSASSSSSCEAGGVVIQLENGAAATVPAAFVVDGKAGGSLAPGKKRIVKIPLGSGESVTVTVVSDGKKLIDHRHFTDRCPLPVAPAPAPIATPTPPVEVVTPPAKALPLATSATVCEPGGGGGGEVTVTLTNGAAATLPASFEVTFNFDEFFDEENPPTTYGPLAPGEILTTPPIEFFPVDDVEVTVTSGGKVIYASAESEPCQGGG